MRLRRNAFSNPSKLFKWSNSHNQVKSSHDKRTASCRSEWRDCPSHLLFPLYENAHLKSAFPKSEWEESVVLSHSGIAGVTELTSRLSMPYIFALLGRPLHMLICLTHYHAYVANHSFYKIAPDLFKMPLIQLITI